MKIARSILAVIILAGMAVCSLPSFSFCQDEMYAESLLFLEIPSVIGVSKKAESGKVTPMSVYVVSNEEMQRWGVHTMDELLARVPGYSFYDTDFYGQTSINTRGIAGQLWRTRFGFELMNIPDYGHWILTPHFFKNAEIARGPAGGLTWGGNAEAGVINFNLRDDLEGLETHVEFGVQGRQGYDVLYGKKFTAEGDGLFVGMHFESQDYTQRNMDNGNAWKENGINPSHSILGRIKDGAFKFIYFSDHQDHIIPKPWFSSSVAMFNTLQALNGTTHDEMEINSFRAEYHVFQKEETDLYLYGETYKKQWFETGIAIDTQRRYAGGFSGNTALLDGSLDVNIGGELAALEQTQDPSFNSVLAINNGLDWYNYGPASDSYNNAYLQGNYKATDKVHVILGGRLDIQPCSSVDRNLFSGPQVGLIYMPSEEITFKGLYNKTFRRPTGNEGNVANANLTSENMNSQELVVMYKKDKASIDLTLFNQVLENQITAFLSPAGLTTYSNSGGVKSNGFEWAAKYLPGEKVNLYWNGSYVNAKVQEAILNGINSTAPHLGDWRPPYTPTLSSFIGCEVSVSKLLKANVALHSLYNIAYIDANGNDADSTVNFIDMNIRTMKLFNKTVSFGLGVTNVADTQTIVPAFGEHVNSLVTMEPQGRKVYVNATMNF